VRYVALVDTFDRDEVGYPCDLLFGHDPIELITKPSCPTMQFAAVLAYSTTLPMR
jgi:hypothetical protein